MPEVFLLQEILKLHTSPPAVLSTHEVHLWVFDLRCNTAWIGLHDWMLSPEEKIRARKFHYQNDRNKYLSRRIFRRQVLGSYLQRVPATLCFEQEQNGKPCLKQRDQDPILHFSSTHSERWCVIAVSTSGPIGVDLEMVQWHEDYLGLSRQYFSAMERAALSKIAESRLARAFFKTWTRKEALLKATGLGLQHTLDTFSVNCTARLSRPQFHQGAGAIADTGTWWVQDVSADCKLRDFTAALVTPFQVKGLLAQKWK